jgi:hypothetical protein
MSTKQKQRLTIEIEPELGDALARWAIEVGRPTGNLARWLLTVAVAEREQQRKPARRRTNTERGQRESAAA